MSAQKLSADVVRKVVDGHQQRVLAVVEAAREDRAHRLKMKARFDALFVERQTARGFLAQDARKFG